MDRELGTSNGRAARTVGKQQPNTLCDKKGICLNGVVLPRYRITTLAAVSRRGLAIPSASSREAVLRDVSAVIVTVGVRIGVGVTVAETTTVVVTPGVTVMTTVMVMVSGVVVADGVGV